MFEEVSPWRDWRALKTFVWFCSALRGQRSPSGTTYSGVRPCRTHNHNTSYSSLFYREIWYPAEQNPAKKQTPWNRILEGLIPQSTWSAGYQTTGNTFKSQISPLICYRIRKYFSAWIRITYGVDSWIKPKVEISCCSPFKGLLLPILSCPTLSCAVLSWPFSVCRSLLNLIWYYPLFPVQFLSCSALSTTLSKDILWHSYVIWPAWPQFFLAKVNMISILLARSCLSWTVLILFRYFS